MTCVRAVVCEEFLLERPLQQVYVSEAPAGKAGSYAVTARQKFDLQTAQVLVLSTVGSALPFLHAVPSLGF